MKEMVGHYKLTHSCAMWAVAAMVLLGIENASARIQWSQGDPAQREFYAKEVVSDAKCLDGSKSVRPIGF